MQKIITRNLKNIKRYLTGGERIITISFGIIISGFLFSNSVSATTMDTNVNIRPSMTLSVSTNDITLNLNPATKPFDTKDLTITIGTNNPTGYKLYLTSDSTNLINTEDSSKTIETLPSSTPASGYDQASFPANYWGYRKSNGSSSSGNYLPFASDLLVSSATGPSNETTTSIGLASKIDYLKESGTYTLDFKLNAIPTITQYYMQDLSDPTLASSVCVAEHPTIVFDSRDEQAYTIQRLPDGNCWMTQNLRYQGDTVGSTSTTTSWIMKSTTSNISEDTTMTMTDLTTGNSYDAARYRVPTSEQIPSGLTADDIGVWYNYAAASAMAITGSSNENPQTYDICPKGWRLPTSPEQSGIKSHASAYSPVAGGSYYSGTLNNTGNGLWWSSTSNGSAGRHSLGWGSSSSSLVITYDYRSRGLYVRCIAK